MSKHPEAKGKMSLDFDSQHWFYPVNMSLRCHQNVSKMVLFSAHICFLRKAKRPENQHNALIFKPLSGVGRD